MSEPNVTVYARSAVYSSANATADLSITWLAAEGTITRSVIYQRLNGASWLKNTLFPDGVTNFTHEWTVNCGPGDLVEWYAEVYVLWQAMTWIVPAPPESFYGEAYSSGLTTTDIYPSHQSDVYGNQPAIMFKVSGGSNLHGHVQLALRSFPADFIEYDVRSERDQTGWQRSPSPYTTWYPLGPEGAGDGDWLQWQAPPLRYDIYYIRARVWANGLYGPWSNSSRWFETVPPADPPLTCTIGEGSYSIEGLRVLERTGGDASEIQFKIPLKEYRARPFATGAPVAVGLYAGGQRRAWNGWADVKPGDAAHVTVNSTQDDASLARLLVLGDTAEADIGANLAALVDQYGDRLSSAGIDTSLGLNAAITGAHKHLRDHLKEWADALDLLLYVDGHRVVHLVDPADLGDPEVILYEE